MRFALVFPSLVLSSLVSLVLAVPPIRAAEGREDVIRKSFAASSGGTVVIDTDRGSVTVEGAETREVEVEVQRKVSRGSDSAAAALLERHQVRVEQDGRTIRVEAELPGKAGWSWGAPQLEVEVRVRVPRVTDVKAETAGGSIRVENLEGEVGIRTSGGSLALRSVAGQIVGRTSGGSVRAERVAGAVELTTSGGSIRVEDAGGERLKVSTSGGSIRLTGIMVPTDARTSGGSVEVESSATPLTASTSGGSVTARMTAIPASEIDLRTSAGGVTLYLPAKSAFDLNASTSAGGVRSEFPVASTAGEKKDRSSLRGPVNGGGPAVRLRTSAGSIRIRQQ